MSLIRAQDHSTIGGLLGATLTPAIFWKHARAIHRRLQSDVSPPAAEHLRLLEVLLGGAGIGAGIGLRIHWIRDMPEKSVPHAQSIPHTPQES